MKYCAKMVSALLTCLAVGCVVIPAPMPPEAEARLRERAIDAVKRAAGYKQAASMRAAGIETMQRRIPKEGLPWIRNALGDRDEGVRFVAIIALGALGDSHSYSKLRALATRESPNIRIATAYALHRLGDTTYTGRLPELLLDHASPAVRRDAAVVLGLLDEPDAVKLLAKAMKDPDNTVQQAALEAMARLGNQYAIQQLTFSTHSGRGYEEVTALNTLAELKDPTLENTFRYKLESSEFREVRLAAARGLGYLKRDDGLRLALRSLKFNSPRRNTPDDPPGEQIVRVRQLAAVALGAIGDHRALRALEERLNDQSDPRVQLAAADAILEILGPRPSRHTPLVGYRAQSARGESP